MSLHLHTIAAGIPWFRIHRCRHATALHWGRHDQGRWNAADGAFGVLYVADCLETAFAETYGHQVMESQAPAVVKFLARQELEQQPGAVRALQQCLVRGASGRSDALARGQRRARRA